MSKRILISATVLALLIATMSIAPANAGSNSTRQIVFMLGDSWLSYTSVSISGYNQNNQWTTWSKQDKNGFHLAYTKNWWWSENFVQISFTIKDGYGNQAQKTCLIDALAQPSNSPRVEIVYYYNRGCVGGDAGSVRDPIKDTVKPIRDAFKTVWYYLPENKFDFFMTLMSNEVNNTGCVLGVAAVIKSGGFAAYDSTVRNYVIKTCTSTGNQVYQLFTGH